MFVNIIIDIIYIDYYSTGASAEIPRIPIKQQNSNTQNIQVFVIKKWEFKLFRIVIIVR